MKSNFYLSLTVLLLVSCSAPKNPTVGSWSSDEIMLVADAPHEMRVLTVNDSADFDVLRRHSIELSADLLGSDVYATLAASMLQTVTAPRNDGVGIAAPQVGISRRIVCVQRFDKEGEPFEIFPNIRITAMRGEPVTGPEGCLSVPDMRGNVPRSRDIEIAYTSVLTMQDTVEQVTGFTAVIFQHECDHLDGVLYTDKCLK